MSKENAVKFVERLKGDEDFRNAYSVLKEEERTKYVAENGFDFTEEEFKEVTAELSVEELEKVAGGCGSLVCNGYKGCDSKHTTVGCEGHCGGKCSGHVW